MTVLNGTGFALAMFAASFLTGLIVVALTLAVIRWLERHGLPVERVGLARWEGS